ncbi:MAG: hypothetical protein HXX15_02905 [Rhodopseudomonas sp.]|uniref:hypothetical protein n=1 Tax=Rhodopseudomonas sp. TaxID=1078 RepID=UPI00185C6CA1|nr:hypothetical protein [Rhodopseudomonas sp.]NVN85015.1 hypothetical protein [Rhodopseudomonas sp.]
MLDDATLEAVDAWAARNRVTRSEAIGRLVRLGLTVVPAATPARTARTGRAIELAAMQIDQLIDPEAPADERDRRIARLTEGPPEFVDARVDLPKRKS